MQPITVKTVDLRAKVVANREGHRKIFEEAVDGYRRASLELLQEHIEEVRSGRLVRIVVNLPYPEDHTVDYDRVIAMLDMSVADIIEIDETTFAAYVMDDWTWKRAFLTSNSAYSATARSLL
jgi:hypothetical protein